MKYNKKIYLALLLCITACHGAIDPPVATKTPVMAVVVTDEITTAPSNLPDFSHIVIIIFENWVSEDSLFSPLMPTFNQYRRDYTFLINYHGVKHPSLPNYLALISGKTFEIQDNCTDCFFDTQTLPDLIEASGRTWKTYQEDMPEPCYIDDTDTYVQKHNPFVYFDAIRLNKGRCEENVVSLDVLQTDIDTNRLPNFIFITPNICHDGHDCPLNIADNWLGPQLDTLIPALGQDEKNYLLVLMFEEGDDDSGCCGLPEDDAGGRVPVVLISPHAKNNYQDATPYSHYSLLKTISDAWKLPYLGHAADPETKPIMAPWK